MNDIIVATDAGYQLGRRLERFPDGGALAEVGGRLCLLGPRNFLELRRYRGPALAALLAAARWTPSPRVVG